MKALSNLEIDELIESLQPLVGGQLQDVFMAGASLFIEIYNNSQSLWLQLVLDKLCPLVFLHTERPRKDKNLSSPVLLFLKAHGRGRRVFKVQRLAEFGRVIEIQLGHEEATYIDFRMFPHGMNLSVRTPEKEVHLFKPKELEAHPNDSLVEDSKPRSRQEIWDQYFAKKQNRTAKSDPEKIRKARIKKIEKAILKVEKDIEAKKPETWQRLGEILSSQGGDALADEFIELYDSKESLSWNINNCFEKAKSQRKKLAGLNDRLEDLKVELEGVKAGEISIQAGSSSKEKGDLFKETGAKGRKRHIAEDLFLYVGKSGKDNLQLLRRAKAWDYWLHIRDLPGSHGILRRNKGRKIKDHELEEAGQFVASASLGGKKEFRDGEIIDLIVTEIRYVQPIKGDKHGRVTIKNDRNLRIRFKAL